MSVLNRLRYDVRREMNNLSKRIVAAVKLVVLGPEPVVNTQLGKLDKIDRGCCPICSAKAQSFLKKEQHTCGDWNEYVQYRCGAELHYSPNYGRVEFERSCPEFKTILDKTINHFGGQEKLFKTIGYKPSSLVTRYVRSYYI